MADIAAATVTGLSPRELRLLRRAAFAGDSTAIAEARRRYPDSKDVLKYSGILHYRCRELATAEDELARAIAVDPDDAEAAKFLMRVQYNGDAYAKCEASAVGLLRIAPDDPDGLRMLGRVYNRRRAWSEAAAAWQQLAAVKPDDIEAPFQAARVLQRLDRNRDALAFAAKALVADPGNGEAARIKIDAALALNVEDHRPVIEAITPYFAIEPDRALDLIRRLARGPDIPASAAMIVALVIAYPADETLRRLAISVGAVWRTEALRAELLDGRKATTYTAALAAIGRVVPDAAPAPAQDTAASAWLAGLAARLLGGLRHAAAALGRWAGIRIDALLARTKGAVPLSSGAILRHAERAEDPETIGGLLPLLVAHARLNPNCLRRVGRLAVKAGAWRDGVELWSRCRGLAADDAEAPLQLARCYAAMAQHDAAIEAAAAVLARDAAHPEALRLRAEAHLAQGAGDEATAAVAALILGSPGRLRTWFAGRREPWTALVGAAAFAAAAKVAPDRPESAETAELVGIDWLGDGFGHEIAGDFVQAFIAFHAAAAVRPGDHDAARGAARGKPCCLAQLRASEAGAALLAPGDAARLMALCGE